jgi:hypothetical protein
MLTANVIPQHSATLHCVWAPAYAGKDIPLAAVWVDTTPDLLPSRRVRNAMGDARGLCKRLSAE